MFPGDPVSSCVFQTLHSAAPYNTSAFHIRPLHNHSGQFFTCNSVDSSSHRFVSFYSAPSFISRCHMPYPSSSPKNPGVVLARIRAALLTCHLGFQTSCQRHAFLPPCVSSIREAQEAALFPISLFPFCTPVCSASTRQGSRLLAFSDVLALPPLVGSNLGVYPLT